MEQSKYWDRPRSTPISPAEMEPMKLFVSADVTSVEALLDDKHNSGYLSSQVKDNIWIGITEKLNYEVWFLTLLNSTYSCSTSFVLFFLFVCRGMSTEYNMHGCHVEKIVHTADSETVNRLNFTVAIKNKTDVELCH